MKLVTPAAFALLLALTAACSPPPAKEAAPVSIAAPIEPMKIDAPAGVYTLDKAHGSLVFRISHMGFSNFTARFANFDVTMNFDPANPTASNVSAKIDPKSLSSDNAPKGFLEDLRGEQWLDSKKYPEITFKSTSVAMTGADTADVTGDFTLHGVTKPVVLHAKLNGGYPGMQYDPHARIGLSATAQLKRSDFGISQAILQPGSYLGLGDDLDVVIETELSGPAWQRAPASTTPH